MVIRWVIDVLTGTMELQESPEGGHPLANRPAILRIPANQFIPQDFVFRCKVVRCT